MRSLQHQRGSCSALQPHRRGYRLQQRWPSGSLHHNTHGRGVRLWPRWRGGLDAVLITGPGLFSPVVVPAVLLAPFQVPYETYFYDDTFITKATMVVRYVAAVQATSVYMYT